MRLINFLLQLIFAMSSNKAAEIKMHKKSSLEKKDANLIALKNFSLEMTNNRVSWKLIFAQPNFGDFNKKSRRN